MSIQQLHNQYLEHKNQTRYPYHDVSGSWMNNFRRLVAPINPFAMEQTSSNERHQHVTYDKAHPFSAIPLPNPVKFRAWLQPHYDATTATEPIPEKKSFGLSGPPQDYTIPSFGRKQYPRVCQRYMGYYKRCVMVNGSGKCDKEENEFLSICPNFAIEEYRKTKVFQEKAKYIQRQEYFEAMEVSSYNKGRSVAQVDGSKRWIDGTSARLRPDSMWIDERYADVTQEEIDAAKKRVAARQAARDAQDHHAAGQAHGQAHGKAHEAHGKAHETHGDKQHGKH